MYQFLSFLIKVRHNKYVMTTMELFSTRLKDLLAYDENTKTEISEETLADAIGVDVAIVYEHLPSYTTALRLRKFFRLSLDFLFGLSEDDSPVNIPKEEKPFSEIFKAILQEKHISRYKLKKETSLARQSIDDWYHGKRIPKIESLFVLAKYFECSLDELTGLKD